VKEVGAKYSMRMGMKMKNPRGFVNAVKYPNNDARNQRFFLA
jgi:hypothetical protein